MYRRRHRHHRRPLPSSLLSSSSNPSLSLYELWSTFERVRQGDGLIPKPIHNISRVFVDTARNGSQPQTTRLTATTAMNEWANGRTQERWRRSEGGRKEQKKTRRKQHKDVLLKGTLSVFGNTSIRQFFGMTWIYFDETGSRISVKREFGWRMDGLPKVTEQEKYCNASVAFANILRYSGKFSVQYAGWNLSWQRFLLLPRVLLWSVGMHLVCVLLYRIRCLPSLKHYYSRSKSILWIYFDELLYCEHGMY